MLYDLVCLHEVVADLVCLDEAVAYLVCLDEAIGLYEEAVVVVGVLR